MSERLGDLTVEVVCAFCSKSRRMVGSLVRPNGRSVAICNECVVICVELMLKTQTLRAKP